MSKPASANQRPNLRRTALAAAAVIGLGILGTAALREGDPISTATAPAEQPAQSGLSSEQLRQKTIVDGQTRFNWVAKRIGGKILADMLKPEAHVANYDGHNMGNKDYLVGLKDTGNRPELFAQFSDETDTLLVRETGQLTDPGVDRVELRFKVGNDTAAKLEAVEKAGGQLVNNDFSNALAQPDVKVYDAHVEQASNRATMRVASGNVADGGLFYTPDAINLFKPEDSIAPGQIQAVVDAFEIRADDAQLAMHDHTVS